MLTVYDIHIELQANAGLKDVNKLKDHFKALSIDVVGLGQNDLRTNTDELSFSIYGNVGPFMMKQMVQECIQNIFPGSIIDFLCR